MITNDEHQTSMRRKATRERGRRNDMAAVGRAGSPKPKDHLTESGNAPAACEVCGDPILSSLSCTIKRCPVWA